MITAITHTAAVLPRQPSSKASDESLVQRIAAGDQLAMRALFARHQVRLYRFLARIVHDQTLAEDLVSDVFLDVWRQAASFEARSSVSTWLLAMGRYKALSALRRRRDVELDAKMASTLVDPADNPETAMQKKNTGEVLRQCVASLSPAHGEIIDLVYYHEKSVSEVAEIRHSGSDREDAHVLCAQAIGRSRHSCIVELSVGKYSGCARSKAFSLDEATGILSEPAHSNRAPTR